MSLDFLVFLIIAVGLGLGDRTKEEDHFQEKGKQNFQLWCLNSTNLICDISLVHSCLLFMSYELFSAFFRLQTPDFLLVFFANLET